MRHHEKTSLFREASDDRELVPSRALQLGDDVRRELAAMWHPLVAPSATEHERARAAELVLKWVPLLERRHFVGQVDTAPLVARFLRDLPAGHTALAVALVKALRATAAARPLDAAVRVMLTAASRREAELGWDVLVELVFLALPESLAEFERRIGATELSSVEVAARHQRTLLALPFEARTARRAAFAAFYRQPASEFAQALLAELDEAPGDVWEGIALAALARPRLQEPFIAALSRRPRPELREVVEVIGATGSFAGSESASRWLRAHPEPSPRSAGLPTPLPRSMPWNDEERSAIFRFVRDPTTKRVKHRRESARTALTRLCKANTFASADLLIEALGLLSSRLEETPVEETFVEVCATTSQRSVLAIASAHLVARAAKRGPLALEHRSRLARRAPEVVLSLDAGLVLYRLALPSALDGWLAAISRLVPVTGVPLDDFVFALALAEAEPAPLQALISACTPNQRRLLVKQAPADALTDDRLRALVRALGASSPATLAVLCERIAELEPTNVTRDTLRSLIDLRWHEGVRRAAVTAMGEVGQRAELELLGGLRELDTRSARDRIISRLSGAGEVFEAHALAFAEDEGRLALSGMEAGDIPSDEIEAAPPVPGDRRLRLGPPPRRVSPLVVATLLLFAPNGVSFFISQALMVGLVGDWPSGWRIALVLGFFLNHVFADTARLLRLLSKGELLMATVRVHTTTTTGKHKTTTHHHTLTLLGDSGRADEHVIRSSSRLDELLDERLEPVLAIFGDNGRVATAWPLDRMDFVAVSDRGHWRVAATAWVLVGLSVVGWAVHLVT